MKNFIVYSFVLLYFIAMMRPILPLMEYVIYEDYIVEFLCINKDKVELQCNGKCYLMQMLQEQNDDKKQNLPKIAMEEYPIGFVQLPAFISEMVLLTDSEQRFHYVNPYSYIFIAKSFHPPSISC
ncbi:MAG: hypothetical protein AAGA43_15955 [Bacteroidota bacterium]